MTLKSVICFTAVAASSLIAFGAHASPHLARADDPLVMSISPNSDLAVPYAHRGIYVLRLNPDGQVDKNFGVNGLTTADDRPEGHIYPLIAPVWSQDHDMFLMAGVDFVSAFDRDGKPKLSFGDNQSGSAALNYAAESFTPSTVFFQGSQILVNEYFRIDSQLTVRMRRLTADGHADPTFSGGVDGIADHAVLGVLPDGRIIAKNVVKHTVMRLTQDGSIDGSFQSFEHNVFGDWLLPLADGTFYMSCRPPTTWLNVCVAHVLVDGTFDQAFGRNGFAYLRVDGTNDWARDAAVQVDGKIVVLANRQVNGDSYASRLALIRFDTDGRLDASFGSHGVKSMQMGEWIRMAFQLEVMPGEKLLLYGDSGYPHAGAYAIRLTEDGSEDASFGVGGLAAIPLQQM